MIVSTRGRYALRVLLDLAEHRSAAYIPMKDVTARQGISQKYIEQIMPVLVKAGFVEGVHGKGGGYRLARAPEDCPVGEILRLTPVAGALNDFTTKPLDFIGRHLAEVIIQRFA